MNKLGWVLIMSFVGNIFAWLHMNAQFRWEWAKSFWWIILGHYWAIRPLGFGMATITFGILTAIFLKELPSLKIWISLLLALAIIILNTSTTLDKM